MKLEDEISGESEDEEEQEAIFQDGDEEDDFSEKIDNQESNKKFKRMKKLKVGKSDNESKNKSEGEEFYSES